MLPKKRPFPGSHAKELENRLSELLEVAHVQFFKLKPLTIVVTFIRWCQRDKNARSI